MTRRAPRVAATIAALAAAAVVLAVVALGTGEYPVPLPDVVATLLGGGTRQTSFIVETLRLPRVVDGLLAGAALGVAGGIFQSLTRNPLGSPDVIGFTAGASAAAVAQILLFGGGAGATAAAAVAGGLITAVLVYGLSFKGGVQGYRLVLVGIGASAMAVALTDFLISRADLEEARGAQVWLNGSLNGRSWEDLAPLALGMAVLLPLVAALAPALRTLELGDEAATALGVRVERTRAALVVAGVVLTAFATAAAGPVPFVALAAPQIARRVTRASGPGLAAAACMGAVLTLAADLVGQRLGPGFAVPVGLVSGVLGGCYLIWLLATEWRHDRG